MPLVDWPVLVTFLILAILSLVASVGILTLIARRVNRRRWLLVPAAALAGFTTVLAVAWVGFLVILLLN